MKITIEKIFRAKELIVDQNDCLVEERTGLTVGTNGFVDEVIKLRSDMRAAGSDDAKVKKAKNAIDAWCKTHYIKSFTAMNGQEVLFIDELKARI